VRGRCGNFSLVRGAAYTDAVAARNAAVTVAPLGVFLDKQQQQQGEEILWVHGLVEVRGAWSTHQRQ
jgi:hypothetical protein